MLKSFSLLGLLCLLLSASVPASAAVTNELIVSIDRDTVQPGDFQQALSDLDFQLEDPTFGPVDCTVTAKVTNYLGEEFFGSAPYYGIAFVSISTASSGRCQWNIQKAIATIEQDQRYTIYSNGAIEPMPGVSGRN